MYKCMPFIALDPAGPEFEFSPAQHRLNSTDAKCVEVIHTSGGPPIFGGFGLIQPVGDVDIYANGGIYHPHCPAIFSTENLITGILWQVKYVSQVAQVNILRYPYISDC